MNELVLNELPENWSWSTFGDVAELVRGINYKKPDASSEPAPGKLPVLRANNIGYGLNFEGLVYVPEKLIKEEQIIKAGDIIIAMSSGSKHLVGKAAQATQDFNGSFGAFCANLRVTEGIDSKYIAYYYSSQVNLKRISASSSGSNINNLKREHILDAPIPLAPPEQQKRIVAKIEELFSHIDAGIEALKKAKQLLKQYRQSVLKAAVTGELTKQWREANKDKLEPASQLLERILKERRQKWEEQQLEQFKARGKMPKDDKWKGKYKLASECDGDYTDQFLSGKALPGGWALCSLDVLSELITDGNHNPPKRVDSGIPHLTARNIVDGGLDFDKCTYLTEEGFDQTKRRYEPKPRDILITCVGTIGRIAVVPENVVFSADRNLAVTRLKTNFVFPEYIEMLLNSPDIQKILLAGSGSTAQPHIYLSQIRSIPISLPAVNEQRAIVEIAQEKLTSFHRLAQELDRQFIKADKNKQSILESSFSGEL